MWNGNVSRGAPVRSSVALTSVQSTARILLTESLNARSSQESHVPHTSAVFGELWNRKCEPPIPARSSIHLKANILHVESLNALPTSGVSRIARRGSSSWPDDSFTELECEGKEAPSHAWNGRTAHSNDLERCWPSGANPRTDRKEVGETHASSRAWPPHAHFRRTHVSARTLLALYNQARLAYLEKAKRLACRVTPVCAPRLVSRNRLGRTPPGTFYAWASVRVTTSTFGRRAARALRHTRPSTAGQSWLRITPQLASGSPWRKPHFR